MQKHHTLSRLERGIALCLALVWFCGGIFGLYGALACHRWAMGFVALPALLYGVAWLRVAARSRLLTWPELIAPWRRG